MRHDAWELRVGGEAAAWFAEERLADEVADTFRARGALGVTVKLVLWADVETEAIRGRIRWPWVDKDGKPKREDHKSWRFACPSCGVQS